MKVVVEFRRDGLVVKATARKQFAEHDQDIGGSIEKAADFLIQRIESGTLEAPLYRSLPHEATVVGCWFSPQKHYNWEYLMANRWPISKDKALQLFCLTERELLLSAKGEPLIRSLEFANRRARFGPKFNLGDWVAL